MKIFKNILNKINDINSLIQKDNNNDNDNDNNIRECNNQNELFNKISDYLENIENYIKDKKNEFLDIKKSENNNNN